MVVTKSTIQLTWGCCCTCQQCNGRGARKRSWWSSRCRLRKSWCSGFCKPILFQPVILCKFSSISFYLVFRIDEGVIDSLGAVAEVEDGVDFLSTVERLWGGDLAHALVGWKCLDFPTWTQSFFFHSIDLYLEFKLGENHAARSDTVDINLFIPGDLQVISIALELSLNNEPTTWSQGCQRLRP